MPSREPESLAWKHTNLKFHIIIVFLVNISYELMT